MGLLGIFNLGTVAVEGASMEPALHHGDWMLVRWSVGTPSIGALYVVERDDQPGVLYIKRLQKSHGELHWFEGDNPSSQDSRRWGWLPKHCIRGKVLFRYKRAR